MFVSLHTGSQVIVWALFNYPQIRMKLEWFYIIHD